MADRSSNDSSINQSADQVDSCQIQESDHSSTIVLNTKTKTKHALRVGTPGTSGRRRKTSMN